MKTVANQTIQSRTPARNPGLTKYAIWAILLSIILVITNPGELWGDNYEFQSIVNLYISVEPDAVKVTENEEWLAAPPFRRMIKNHSQYLAEFVRWRRLFSRYAIELAALIKTFPGSECLSEDRLRRVITEPETFHDCLPDKDIFAPWTNRWSGVWSNGTTQYHIWDSAGYLNGQWIQPVSLSETGFVEFCCTEEMMQKRKVDVAINVFSRENGITGWVSKCQHGRAEMPHIGYLINDTTLVWICQIKNPQNLWETDNRWFVFLETTDRSIYPAEYRIYGQQVILEDSRFAAAGQLEKHFGTYYATPAAYQAKGNINNQDIQIARTM